MLTYDFSKRESLPLYDYLYRCVKNDILLGKLRSGEKLPSKRELSEHLGISVVTVENAFSQLAAEGYIYSEEKRGYFVSAVVAQQPMPVKQSAGSVSLQEDKNNNDKEFFMDFVSGSPPVGSFPMALWTKLMRRVMSERGEGILREAPAGGIPELRASIADYLYRFRGMSVSPEQIIIGAGAEYMYGLVIQLLGRDKIYALEDPGYTKIAKIYEINGSKTVRIPLDPQGVPPDLLEQSGAQVLHISPTHHFPTGIVTPAGRRSELLSWADKGRYIIEDDYDSEFRFSGRPIPAMQSLDTGGRVLYINTFSKTISPSMRISYLVLPQELLEKYKSTMGFYSCTVPVLEQYTLAEFISIGAFERHINRMKKYYHMLRDDVLTALDRCPFRKKAEILERDSGLHFLLRVKTIKTDEELILLARQAGIRISCLSEYSARRDPSLSGQIVVNYTGINRTLLPEAAARLTKVFC